jgi:hypothetical protein
MHMARMAEAEFAIPASHLDLENNETGPTNQMDPAFNIC